MKFLLPLLLFLAAPPLFAQSFLLGIDVDDPPQGILSEEWAEMFLDGEKIGYTRTLLERRGDVVVTVNESFLGMGRGEARIDTTTVTEIRERIDGTPLSLSLVTNENGRVRSQLIRFSGEGAVVTTTAGGRTWDHEVDLEPGFVLSWSFVRKLAALGEPAPGDSVEARLYSPEITVNAALPVTTLFAGEETIPFRGGERKALRVEQRIQVGFLPMDLTVWIDPEGHLLRGTVPVGGMNILLLGSTREQATARFEAPELFESTLIPLDRPVPVAAEEVVYRLRTEGPIAGGIPESAAQRVSRRAEGDYEITVRRGRLDATDGPLEVDGDRYLAPSPLVDYEDPAIRAIVESVDWEDLSRPDRLRALVNLADEAIETKSLDLGFATASETVALSEGDCTEHALLLAALARATGFPARGASGLAAFADGNGEPVMGYHMWTQVWDGEEWIDLDAAFGEAETSPVRILLSTSDLSDNGFADEVLAVAQMVGRTEVEIVEATSPAP